MGNRFIFVGRRLAVVLGLAAVLAGCSHGGVRDDAGRPVADVHGAFMRGELRLRCGLGCAAAWGAERPTWVGLYRNQLWGDLALHVADVNFQGDVQYFYLGRSAEGMGYYKAASTYYRLARATVFKCRAETCDGLNVPAQVNAGLARIAQAPPASLCEGDDKPL